MDIGNLIQLSGMLKELLEEVCVLMTLVSVFLGYLSRKHKARKNELTRLINKSSLPNEEFLETAKEEGLNKAAKEIRKLPA